MFTTIKLFLKPNYLATSLAMKIMCSRSGVKLCDIHGNVGLTYPAFQFHRSKFLSGFLNLLNVPKTLYVCIQQKICSMYSTTFTWTKTPVLVKTSWNQMHCRCDNIFYITQFLKTFFILFSFYYYCKNSLLDKTQMIFWSFHKQLALKKYQF